MKYATSARFCTVIITLVSALSLQTLPSHATDLEASEATRKVNLAGRQRMLTQRMSMAACYATLGIEPVLHFEKLATAHAEFAQVHQGLRFGDLELELEEEGYKHVIDALNVVDTHWSTYQPIVEALLSIQMMSDDALNAMDAKGLAVLHDMNVTVGTIANTYAGDLENLPEILTLSIDFAGRQRMLTQKISKEFCMIEAGLNVEENVENLRVSREQFNLTQQALEVGVPRLIVEAPTPEILAKLREVDELWIAPNAIFARVEAGEIVSRWDVEHVVHYMDDVLIAMDEVVALYEDVHGLPNF